MRICLAICLLVAAAPAAAEVLILSPREIVEWKAVYGQVETRDRVPARARIGGNIVELDVTEGDRVEAGERVAHWAQTVQQLGLLPLNMAGEELESSVRERAERLRQIAAEAGLIQR